MAVRDVIFIAVIIFAFAIVFTTIFYAGDQMITRSLNSSVLGQYNASNASLHAVQTKVLPRFDDIIFALFIGLILGLMITSWFIGGNPIFMAVYFIGIVVAVVVSSVLAYVWDMYITKTPFNTFVVKSFPITNHLIHNFPYYIAIVGCLGMLVMFAKPYVSTQG